MEEVQSWWEVPTVAHFFYTFRTAFKLTFFEIAELESALLDMQDPDVGVSVEQLTMRLLQSFFEQDEPVTEYNWEEKLHELFNDNFEETENPLAKCAHFLQLTPKSKIEVLLKLCELRLDCEGVMEEVKNVPSEDMKAKCLGKDSQNNLYWYFCDERLYKEDQSISTGKAVTLQRGKDVKSSGKNAKQTVTREKRAKSNQKETKPWTIACFNLSEWENFAKKLSKSKNSEEKKLATALEEHLPVVQKRVAEKERILRKRFLESAPKRQSSRISKVQEKKKLEELAAQETAEKARIKAEEERAKKEAERKKQEILERQKRVEERQKRLEQIVEERAERAKLRELARVADSESSDEEEAPKEDPKRKISRKLKSAKNRAESEREESEEGENGSERENGEESEVSSDSLQRSNKRVKMQHDNKQPLISNSYRQRSSREDKSESRRKDEKKSEVSTNHLQISSKRIKAEQANNKPAFITYSYKQRSSTEDKNECKRKYREESEISSDNLQTPSKLIKNENTNIKQSLVTYSYRQRSYKEQIENGQQKSSLIPRSPEKQKYQDSSECESEINGVPELNRNNSTNSRIQQSNIDFNKQPKTCATSSESDNSSTSNELEAKSSEINHREIRINSNNSVTKANVINLSNPNGSLGINLKNFPPGVTVYKSTFIKSSNMTRWNSTLDSKGQKLHILHHPVDNLSANDIKLEEMKTTESFTGRNESKYCPNCQNYIIQRESYLSTVSKFSYYIWESYSSALYRQIGFQENTSQSSSF